MAADEGEPAPKDEAVDKQKSEKESEAGLFTLESIIFIKVAILSTIFWANH